MRQLFLAYPKADSGALSWLKMVFVCNASLAYLSVRILELHKHLLHDSSALSRTIHLHVEEIYQIDLNAVSPQCRSLGSDRRKSADPDSKSLWGNKDGHGAMGLSSSKVIRRYLRSGLRRHLHRLRLQRGHRFGSAWSYTFSFLR